MPGSEFPPTRLGDALTLVRRTVPVDPGKTYALIGVKLYAAGIRLQGHFKGQALNAPALYHLMPGDIIYNKMWASKGTFALVDNRFGDIFCTSEYPAFTSKPGNNAHFIANLLSNPRLWHRADAWSLGTTDRARLSPKDFLRLPVWLPDGVEQDAITSVLSSIENDISRTRELLKALASTKFAVMRDLLTRGMRRDAAPLQPLPERWVLGRIAGDVTHIPSDWKLVRLTSVAKLESGHTPDRKQPDYWNGDIPWISLQDADALGKLTINDTAETIGTEGLKNSSARMLPPRTVVFQRTANVGLCAIMEREMCTSQHFANWVCGPKLLPEYLQQVFRHMQREWLRLVAGSVLPDIYMPTFKRLQILLPPLEEQGRIAEMGASFDLRIEREKDELARLNDVRAALAQELLSGRLRLPASMVARFANVAAQPEVAVA